MGEGAEVISWHSGASQSGRRDTELVHCMTDNGGKVLACMWLNSNTICLLEILGSIKPFSTHGPLCVILNELVSFLFYNGFNHFPCSVSAVGWVSPISTDTKYWFLLYPVQYDTDGKMKALVHTIKKLRRLEFKVLWELAFKKSFFHVPFWKYMYMRIRDIGWEPGHWDLSARIICHF